MAKKKVVENNLGLRDSELNLAERRMIVKEKRNGEYNFVENALTQHIDSDIDFLMMVLENVKFYQDPYIYRIVPEYLDTAVRNYGIELNNYAKGVKQKLKPGNKYTIYPEEEFVCTKCGKPKAKKYFYSTEQEQYSNIGIYPVCRDCCEEIAAKCVDRAYGDVTESVVMMCQKLDIPVIKEILDNVLAKTVDDEKIIYNGIYFREYMYSYNLYIHNNDNNVKESQRYFCYTNLNGVPFRRLSEICSLSAIYLNQNIAYDEEDSVGLSNSELRNLKIKWGDFPPEKIKRLESTYEEWYNRHEINNGKNDEMFIKQICYEELGLIEARERNEPPKNTKALVDSLSSLVKQANLVPKKKVADEEQKRDLGSWIKEFEKNKPILLKDPDFKDVDGIQKISDNIAGALQRTLLKPGEYTQKMDENLKEHTVSFNINSIKDNDE